jgi:hypothetical protein
MTLEVPPVDPAKHSRLHHVVGDRLEVERDQQRIGNMKALRRRAAVAPFLVSVNPTYGAGLGRRPPQEPKHSAETSVGGIVSIRRGNAGSWTAMIGMSPFRQWELALPDTEEVRPRFMEEAIEDSLLVITYTLKWPPGRHDGRKREHGGQGLLGRAVTTLALQALRGNRWTLTSRDRRGVPDEEVRIVLDTERACVACHGLNRRPLGYEPSPT